MPLTPRQDARRKKIVEKTLTRLRQELSDIHDREQFRTAASLIGRCYRRRDSYACAEKPSEYWWIYRRIKSLSHDGKRLVLHQFLIDSRKEMRCTYDYSLPIAMIMSMMREWTPISRIEFDRQWTKFVLGIKQIWDRS